MKPEKPLGGNRIKTHCYVVRWCCREKLL